VRRGGPTAHKALEAWHHDAQLHGDPAHFGTSMATLAAMTGLHESMLIIEGLPVSAEWRMAAVKSLNYFIAITCHGQCNDIMNEAAGTLDEKRVEDVLLWKTAYYTVANPLQFGAILAGAPADMLDALMRYSMAAGRAFQISDDILGMYGDAKSTGKSPADDIREGKRTLLIVKALELASKDDAAFLDSQLGNAHITPEEFERCKEVIRTSGALQFVQKELERSCREAIAYVHEGGLPDGDEMQFISGLATYLMDRKA
jgi:geranylgeranyl diphosphate synthase, type I